MRRTIVRNLLRPLLERIGTALAAVMIATGWDGELVHQLVTALTAAVFVAADLVLARLNRESE